MASSENGLSADVRERLIRRAWEDEEFAGLLGKDPRAAIASETGVELPASVNIQVHQEGEATFHLVVPAKPLCPGDADDDRGPRAQLTRRACEDESFAERLKNNPRAAIKEETGIELPAGLDLRVHREDESTLHLVVPVPPGARRDLPAGVCFGPGVEEICSIMSCSICA
jgi:hypothetical protein